jgi:hypothetical protein
MSIGSIRIETEEEEEKKNRLSRPFFFSISVLIDESKDRKKMPRRIREELKLLN